MWQTSLLQRAMLASLRPSRGDSGEALSIAEQIAMQLAEEIVNDRLPPDTRIQEIGVATRFKVSRGPVREALRILETSGLVQILPRRGAVVTKLSPDEVADLFEIRSVLFGLVATRVAQHHSDADLEAFRTRLDRLRGIAARQDDTATADFVEAVQEFGLTMSESAGSERLTSFVTMLFHQTLRYSRLGVSTHERRQDSVMLWEQLVDHIQHGRSEPAESTARSIVRRSRAFAIKLLEAGERQ
ncbi:MAG: GntR family transcriptional regulator [Rhodobacteraceae bacterium]|nr:GntR family transcriptional regulator [Paracoccaceae bacterium]